MRDECEHGMLRRKCDRCEEHAEIERLRTRLAEIDAELAAAMFRGLSPSPAAEEPAPRVTVEGMKTALEQGAREAQAAGFYRRHGYDDPSLVASHEVKPAGQGEGEPQFYTQDPADLIKCQTCKAPLSKHTKRLAGSRWEWLCPAAPPPSPRPAEAALERMKCCDAPRPVIGCDCLRCMEANTRTAILAKHTAEAALVALRGEVREVLNPLEWRTSEFRLNSKSCPECFRYEEFGHLPDCRLAALLKRVAPAEARRDDSGLF